MELTTTSHQFSAQAGDIIRMTTGGKPTVYRVLEAPGALQIGSCIIRLDPIPWWELLRWAVGRELVFAVCSAGCFAGTGSAAFLVRWAMGWL